VLRLFESSRTDAPSPPAPARPAVTPPGRYITDGREFNDRQKIYLIEREMKQRELDERLLAREAASRGLSSEGLLRVEVEGRVPSVADAEARAYLAANRSRFSNTTEQQALQQIRDGLRRQRLDQRRQEFARSLMAKYNEFVTLEPPRMDVSADDDPSLGPADAKVVIIEFAGFQCAFCGRAAATLRELRARYGGSVRHVYRDFPLLAVHPFSAKAAEAASCAHEQGRFWAMHDRLFANQGQLGEADLHRHAAAVGLLAAPFAQCLSSGRYEAEWRKDLEDGTRYGLISTPSFFINGRLLMGALPIEAFTQIIEEELRLNQP
jgi:protein-disulfide isomerase